MPSEKQVILCQGDKKELEEITGRKYEYIKGEIIVQDSNNEPTYVLKEKNVTFMDAIARTPKEAQGKLGSMPIKYNLDIDAFIDCHPFKGDSNSQGDRFYARGTPMRLKNKK